MKVRSKNPKIFSPSPFTFRFFNRRRRPPPPIDHLISHHPLRIQYSPLVSTADFKPPSALVFRFCPAVQQQIQIVIMSPFWVYRRPPRRVVRLVKDANKEEEIKEVVRTCYLSKCKRSGWSLVESIPDEMLFEILARLPAQDIYYESRLVCRKWYHMMRTKNFTHTHLEHASYGLLFMDESRDVVFISARDDGGGINTYKLNYKFRRTVSWSTCDGLMLEFDFSSNKMIYFYVANVSTDQAFRLPPFHYDNQITSGFGIGYDATSNTYKVVASYVELGYGYGCAILTVGVDKSWRRVRTDHLSKLVRPTLNSVPIYTEGGFLHWNKYVDIVLTLNLETEIIAETPPPIPKVVPKEKAKFCCISTGRYLSFFLRRSKLVWEVFEMKPETGEWRKLPNICLEGQKGRIIERLGSKFQHYDVEIMPCGWLKYPEVLALRIQCVLIIFYNLVTCEIGAEKFCIWKTFFAVTLHRNSLVWLGGP